MATNINNKLVCNEPHANLDSYYGPYDSVHAAYLALADTTVNGVNYTKKYIGLTVGVWNSSHNEIIEYWFKGGLNESNLVLKTCDSGGLPDGVKVVTFDKNGGSGVQNSLLTDTSGQLRLPECTFTKSGDTFKKWLYNGSEKSEGDIITVTTSTAVKAVWQSTPTQYYTVSWANSDNVTIKGKADRPISSGDSLPKGTRVTLTATPASGYTLIDWTNKPTGATMDDNNNLTFILNSNTLNITAVVEAETQYYTVSWTAGAHISSISGKYNENTPITSGSTQIPAGSTVTLTANAESGCQFTQWSNLPSGVSTSSNPVTFTLNGSVSGITAVGEAETQYYTVSWNNDDRIPISGKYNGNNPITSGITQIPAGSSVVLTATPSEGFSFNVWNWSHVPSGVDLTVNPLTFTLNNNASDITAVPNVFRDVYIYASSSEKTFSEIESLTRDDEDQRIYIPHTYNYIVYYITKQTNVAPTYIVDGDEKNITPINECGNSDIIKHFVETKGWIEEGSNKTKGDLKQKGNYLFVLLDEQGTLNGKSVTIKYNR